MPSEIEVIRGRIPAATEREFREMMNYESGQADRDAAQVPGPHKEPWLNVIDRYEPASLPGYDRLIDIPKARERIRGKVLDLGAGTCWLSARLSQLPAVDTVYAMDLSERFLRTTGDRIINHFGGQREKIKFVIGDFNAVPLPDESIDCAFLWAALHHSLSPIKTLREVGRCLKPGGTLVVFEIAHCTLRIREARQRMLEQSHTVTEIAYTKGELDYMIANSQIGSFEAIPIDAISSGGAKMMVRKVLRRAGLEDHLINPPCYAFLVTKERKG